jgi:protein gp37
VPDEWIHQVIEVAENCPQHIFQFLTKNPKRLSKFPWANNCWVGTTVTNQADADERIPWLLKVQAPVRFVSHEPLLSAIDMKLHLDHEKALDRAADMMDLNNPGKAFALGLRAMYRPVLEWAIIGAMTGPGAVKPKPKWILGLIDQYRAAGVPIFLKDNLYKEPLGWTKKIQEWPAGKRE